MITVDIGDIMSVVNLISGHLIALAVILVAVIAVIIVSCIKLKRPTKGLVNGTALMAFVLVAVLIVNMMLTGPCTTP